VIGIEGPMGCGKTTLVKKCIAEALGLPMVTLPLGGMHDGAVLKGHLYSYNNGTHGRLAGALIEARCMNPVLLFGELDKVSGTVQGAEVVSALIHLTDPATNSAFQDQYFDGVPLDFSRAVMVFTYNNAEAVNPILRDRMTRVRVAGYTAADKRTIATDHLLPALCREYGFEEGRFVLDEGALEAALELAGAEDGVRNLQRALHDVLAGVNLRECMSGAGGEPGVLRVDSALVREFVERPAPAAGAWSHSQMYV
jgi:ATP-dependent Lon protease